MRTKEGQSAVEYLVLVAVVIVVLIFFVRENSFFQRSLNETIEAGTNRMVSTGQRIFHLE